MGTCIALCDRILPRCAPQPLRGFCDMKTNTSMYFWRNQGGNSGPASSKVHSLLSLRMRCAEKGLEPLVLSSPEQLNALRVALKQIGSCCMKRRATEHRGNTIVHRSNGHGERSCTIGPRHGMLRREVYRHLQGKAHFKICKKHTSRQSRCRTSMLALLMLLLCYWKRERRPTITPSYPPLQVRC